MFFKCRTSVQQLIIVTYDEGQYLPIRSWMLTGQCLYFIPVVHCWSIISTQCMDKNTFTISNRPVWGSNGQVVSWNYVTTLSIEGRHTDQSLPLHVKNATSVNTFKSLYLKWKRLNDHWIISITTANLILYFVLT